MLPVVSFALAHHSIFVEQKNRAFLYPVVRSEQAVDCRTVEIAINVDECQVLAVRSHVVRKCFVEPAFMDYNYGLQHADRRKSESLNPSEQKPLPSRN